MATLLGKLVRVTWEDAHGSAANVAYELEEIPHAAIKVVSYGILLKDDEAGVSIASEVCDATVYRGYGFMPRKMVLAVDLVKSPNSARRRRPLESPASTASTQTSTEASG